MGMSRIPIAQSVSQAKVLYSKYERYFPATFFVGGFLFDIFTLGRIDSLSTIIQQAAYLLVLFIILAHLMVEQAKSADQMPNPNFYRKWRVPAMHFLFGSLLSSYTLFYFKSASLATSFVFLIFMVALLVANEFPRFQIQGLTIKFALLSLSYMSYFAYLVPTLVGRSGTLVFLLSILLGLLPSVIWFRLGQKLKVPEPAIRAQVLRPALIVFVCFLVSYVLRIIPPVPLSLQYLGIYHNVAKNAQGEFELSHQRPWWRFWHNGDQNFIAQPGDKIIAFFRLFSPANFSDQVFVSWYLDDAQAGWTLQDRIPIKISGGREEGFRGYAAKSNYTTGRWRVVVESTDGREIGRLSFDLDAVTATPREFKVDRF